MSDKEKDLVRLHHISEALNSIFEFTKDTEKDTFLKSDLIQSAVVRKLEIIGEAVAALSDSTKESGDTIPWHKIKGLRNILIHEYFKVDANQIWETIEFDLPSFKVQIEELILQLN